MSPAAAVFFLMNNYFHDVATAMLIASGVTMRVIIGHLGDSRNPEVLSFMLWLYSRISKIVVGSLIWITVSAIPRILTFTSFEWVNALNGRHVPGLFVKHVVAFLMIVAGIRIWLTLIRRVDIIKRSGNSYGGGVVL